MKGNTWSNIVKPVVVLVAICLVASGLLAGVNELTAPIIAEQEEAAANAAYYAVLPEAYPADGVIYENLNEFTLEGLLGYTKYLLTALS